MKREASDRLDHWIRGADRKPLVLRGARQTGKTWIVRDLAKRNNRKLVEVNFERNPEFSVHFSSKDPVKVLQQLSAEFGYTIAPENALLFLDEIQAVPLVFSVLRWFKEEMPALPVIAAGSLLDFALKDQAFSMPVGRISYFYLEPMSFLEFVAATGNSPLYESARAASFAEPLSEVLHQKCLELYHVYCLCGGMPEAVNKWMTSGDMNECLAVQTDLLATFHDDFNKYGRNGPLLRKVLRSAAEQLGNKFVLSRVGEDLLSRDVGKAISLIAMARVVSLVLHSAGNGIPLGSESNEKFFKALFVDTGLVACQLGIARMRPEEARNIILNNKGELSEQFAGQQLRYALAATGNTELYYWQRTGGRQGEIDYLLQAGNRILPVEVKSGSGGSMKSLHQFMFDKKLDTAVRFDMNNFSRMELNISTTRGDPVNYSLLSIPIYLAERILDLV